MKYPQYARVEIVEAIQIKSVHVRTFERGFVLEFIDDCYPKMILPIDLFSGLTAPMSYLVRDEIGNIYFESQKIFKLRYRKLSDGNKCQKTNAPSS